MPTRLWGTQQNCFSLRCSLSEASLACSEWSPSLRPPLQSRAPMEMPRDAHKCEGQGECCYRVRGAPITAMVRKATQEEMLGGKEKNLVSKGSPKWKKRMNMKKTCKEESNGKLLNIISSVFLKTETFVSLYERGKQFLTNTFNVRSSKEYLRGPGNRTAALDQSKRNPFNSASCDSSREQMLGSTQGQNQHQQSSPESAPAPPSHSTGTSAFVPRLNNSWRESTTSNLCQHLEAALGKRGKEEGERQNKSEFSTWFEGP